MNALSLFNDWLNNEDYGFSGMNARCTVPEVDVLEQKDSYVLNMDLPGRCEKDVELELNDGVLTICSSKENRSEEKTSAENNENKTEEAEKPQFLLRERRRAQFRRSFTLPKDIDGEMISAGFKNGVLTVTIPRKAEIAPRKIQISIA